MISVIAFLLLFVSLILYVPAVQNFAKNKVIIYLKNKAKTEIQLASIHLQFPKVIVLSGFYIEDQKKDTLLYAGKLKVDISMLQLLNHKVDVPYASLVNATVHVYRKLPDTAFNFAFITKAFASTDSTAKPVDTSKSAPLTFSLGKIELQHIFLTYDDDVTGYDALLRLSNFEANIKEFDLSKSTYRLKSIKLEGVSGFLYQKQGLKEAALPKEEMITTSEPFPIIGLDKIELSNIDFRYKNDVLGLVSSLKLGDFRSRIKSIDLNEQKIVASNFSLDNASATVSIGKSFTKEKSDTTKTRTPSSQKGWIVSLGDLIVKNTSVKYDNNSFNPIKSGMDFNHMVITGLAGDVKSINYNSGNIKASINNIAFNEKCGFQLKKLESDVEYDNYRTRLKNLKLLTSNTDIQTDIVVTYPSMNDLTKNIGLLGIEATILKFKLGIEDVLYFQPQLATNSSLKNILNKTIFLEGSIHGKVNDLYIKNLTLKAGTQTQLSLNAKIKGLPDFQKSVFDIDLKEFITSKTDIDYLVPSNLIPSSIQIPNRLRLSGEFKGALNNFNTQLNLISSSGNAELQGRVIASTQKGNEQYNGRILLQNLNLGYLLKNEQVGRVSMSASLSGSGTTMSTANAELKSVINNIILNGYEYKNLELKCSLKAKVLTAQAQITDPNISFTLNGLVSMQQKYPALKLNGIIDSVNLNALNLSSGYIKLRGEINANVPTADLNYLNGTVDLFNFLIVKDKTSIPIDSIHFIAKSTADSNSMLLLSPFMNASLRGKYQLSNLGEGISQIINKYFKQDLNNSKKIPPQQLVLNATISLPKFVKEIYPGLSRFETSTITAKLNTQEGQLTVNGVVPGVTYQKIELDKLSIDINTDSTLDYKVSFDKLTNPEITLYSTSLEGSAKNNEVTINLSSLDKRQKDKYFLQGLLKLRDKVSEFVLGKKLILNYADWQVANDNSIKYSSTNLLIHDLLISQQGQSLKINSDEQSQRNPLNINFNNFHLETLTKLAEQDSAIVGGVLNGKAVIENIMRAPVFVADINVKDFRFKSSKVGDVKIAINNKQTNAYSANITIKGAGNDLNLNGTYYTQQQSAFDLKLAIKNLNLNSVESFTFGQIKNSTGAINGDLSIKGTVDEPEVNGSINFDKASFILTYLNSYFTLKNERINFDDQGINFNQFTVLDSAKNAAVIDGNIYTKTFRDFRFGLNITTENFRALNTKQNTNESYYGPVYIDSDINITGTLDQPKINIEAKLREKSVLTLILPSGTPGVVNREGVIEFVDMNLIRQGIFLSSENIQTNTNTSLKGLELSANIEVDKDAEFCLIVDQQSGDNLRVKGTAQLNATMDLSGKVSLTGTYVITEGAYELSLSGIVRRKFNIQEGSSITWTGEPTSANVDITAVYNLATSATELFESQAANTTEAADKNKYKQKLPFEVKLFIKNELMHPEISFGLDMPESERNKYAISSSVYNRLKQINVDESELNKQVLGLLVMNHFVASNPFSSLESSGSGTEGIVRQSASKLLSQELNNLAGDLIQGVDLSFNVASEEDYSSGKMENRTDLNVGLSKDLMRGRTTVYVGSNFELEGEETPYKKGTNIAGDVAIEYKLSRDGRYRLRAYRKDEYESVVEGQVIETGLTFSLTIDYNKFRELFQKKANTAKHKNKKNSMK